MTPSGRGEVSEMVDLQALLDDFRRLQDENVGLRAALAAAWERLGVKDREELVPLGWELTPGAGSQGVTVDEKGTWHRLSHER